MRSRAKTAADDEAFEAWRRGERLTDWDRRRRRGRWRSIRRTIGTVLLVGLIGVVIGAILLGMRVAAFNGEVSTAPAVSSSLFGALGGEERVNVLMVGYGGGTHQGAFLADSITILSIDPQADATSVIAIPRDLWIEGLPQLPDNGKVNEVFAIGEQLGGIEQGGAMLAEVLTQVTGLQIDHWLAIDFDGFREMVDAVGGVTITNPTAFAYAQREADHAAGRWNSGSFAAGTLELDGAEALAYARARYTSVVTESSDFARSVRQSRIMAALRTKLGDGGVGSLFPGLGLMDAAEGRLQTDLSAVDLFLLSGHMGADRRIPLPEGPVLRATTNTLGQYILIPSDWAGPGDYDLIAGYLSTELAKPIPSPTPAPSGAP